MTQRKKKVFLCQEDGEQFIMVAEDLKEAQEDASLYNGEALRELNKKEYEKYDKDGHI